MAEELDTHKAIVVAEREVHAAHVRAVEDRAHAEIDRAREETKILKTRLRQLDREVVNAATRLEKALGLAKAADHVAVQNEARAQTLEKQLARMDGLPAALLAAQRATLAATQREAKLQEKLNNISIKIRNKSPVRREKSLKRT